MKETAVLNVNAKGQAQLPEAWREHAGLHAGGKVLAVELTDGSGGLLLTPVRRPKRTSKGLAKLLLSCPAPLPVPERHMLPAKLNGCWIPT